MLKDGARDIDQLRRYAFGWDLMGLSFYVILETVHTLERAFERAGWVYDEIGH